MVKFKQLVNLHVVTNYQNLLRNTAIRNHPSTLMCSGHLILSTSDAIAKTLLGAVNTVGN